MQPGSNVLLIISLVILAVSVVTAGAVFGYQKYLESVIEVKNAALTEARSQIDREQVEELIRLKQRFDSGKELLRDHVSASQLFVLLESVTLENVSFGDMTLTVADDRSATISLTGTARNFNTLAAQSNEIAAQRDFKRAIFSEISLNDNGTVGFTLNASLDADLLRMEAPEAPAPAPVEEVEEVAPPVTPEPPAATTTTPAATTSAPAATTTTSL
jgi:Tfp pilus assembly protein PilN